MDISFGLNPEMISVFDKLWGMLVTAKFLTVLGLSFVTFKVLDIFLETNLIVIKQPKLPRHKVKLLTMSLVLIAGTAIPIAIGVRRAWVGQLSGSTALYIIITVALTNIIIGWMIKRMLLPDDSNRQHTIMFIPALSIAISIIIGRLGYWLQCLFMGLLNVFLDAIRGPFVMYYSITSTIMNVALSLVILVIIGKTQTMGAANIVGSMIGGLAHALVRRKRINELQAEYKARQLTEVQPEEPAQEVPEQSVVDRLRNIGTGGQNA